MNSRDGPKIWALIALSFIVLIMQIVSVAVPVWTSTSTTVQGTNNNEPLVTTLGLFRTCFETFNDTTCVDIEGVLEAYLHAVRALAVIAILLQVAAMICTCMLTGPSGATTTTAMLTISSALFTAGAVTIYIFKTYETINADSNTSFGYCVFIEAFASVMGFVCGCVACTVTKGGSTGYRRY
jgi:hypothetical protein